MQTSINTVNNPATQTLRSVIDPFLKSSVLAVDEIEIPGVGQDQRVDLLLVGEYETVGIVLSASTVANKDWKPKYPLGLVTELYSIPAATLFFHLDDFAYLLCASNPSLFVSNALQDLGNRASDSARSIADTWIDGPLLIRYPSWVHSDLEIQRHTVSNSVHTSRRQVNLAA